MALLPRIRSLDVRAIARALTLVEARDTAFLDELDGAFASIPHPQRVGITGPPGAGKSTLTSALVKVLRANSARVGVVAVDPSSPFSGGALLGDRLRMNEHTLDQGVFVRSMAARGHFGGLALSTEEACDVLALAGFDPLLVETVGVGQSEVDVARLADTTVVVLTPAGGDSVQALKAGIMEIADVVAINKADNPGADRLEEDIKEGFELRPHPAPGEPMWLPPIVRTVATAGTGAAELLAAIKAHRAHLEQHGLLASRRAARLDRRFHELALQRIADSLQSRDAYAALREAVQQGKKSPRAAAAEL